jgi:hypothetical protein
MAFRRAAGAQIKRRTQPRLSAPERPTSTRRTAPKGPDIDTVLLVLRRATRDGQPCCEVCSKPAYGERSLDWSVHHRRGRDGRPDSNSPANLLLVCGADNQSGCHGRIHQRRSESQPAGWWISRIPAKGGVVADPLTIPVLIDGGSRWVYLGADGTYVDIPAVAA